MRAATPLTVSEAEVEQLRGVNERLTLSAGRGDLPAAVAPAEPLRRRDADASQGHRHVPRQPAGEACRSSSGSPAASPSARAPPPACCRRCCSRWPDHPRVDLVTTDGFLFPNRVLEERGLMARKGFPESYDVRRLLEFLIGVKSGQPRVAAPVYSHLLYDIVPGQEQVLDRPGHHDPRRAERAADERSARGPAHGPVRVRLLRLLDLHGCERREHRAVVRGSLPDAAPDGVHQRGRRTFTGTRRSARTRRSRSRAASGARSTT